MSTQLDRIPSSSEQTRCSNQDAHEVQNIMFSMLPTEMILEICKYLSPVDTACFALCCHASLSTIGTDSLLFLKTVGSTDRKEFLITMAQKEMSSYYFCHVCWHLHQWASVKMPTSFRPNRKECARCARQARNILTPYMDSKSRTNYFLNFVHLQLAMRRFRYGPEYGITLDSLSHFEILRPGGGAGTTLRSIEARVCPLPGDVNRHSLCVRIQQWTRMSAFSENITCIPLCSHTYRTQLSKKIQPSEAELKPHRETYQCPGCLVDYQLHFEALGERVTDTSMVLITTKWLDMGEGLDPGDPHLLSKGMFYDEEIDGQEIRSVRQRFESQPGLPQEQLTAQNRQRFEDSLTRKVEKRVET